MITNREIADKLRQVAAVFEVKDGDFFRARAYQNAADAIENLTTSVNDLFEQGRLGEIPGVGKNIQSHLEELFQTGGVRHFDSEIKRVPEGMFPLLAIRGVGPKTAYKIASRFKLNNSNTVLKEVQKLIRQNKISNLPGFGQKTQQKMKSEIEFSSHQDSRIMLSEALIVSISFINYVRTIPEVIEAKTLGSLRRRTATVGDIDIGICTDKPKEVIKKVLEYKEIEKVLISGEKSSRVRLKNGRELDFKISTPGEWGSMLQHFTGSKLHNIQLRTRALDLGLSLSEHGIKDIKINKIYKARTEEAFYEHLKLQYIPPEIREGSVEIELAMKHQIPELIKIKDIKGDLHIHSDFKFESSHDLGQSSLSSILDEAIKLKYEFIGISDHNPKFKGLSQKEKETIIKKRKKTLITQLHEYENTVKKRVPKLLLGLEVDIRKDGSLALEDELFSELDYVIASIHSSFDLSKSENTKRIIKALSHPKVVILGHPTTRIINRREGIDADWNSIIMFCKENNKVLELNGTPSRLDISEELLKVAVKAGTKIAINTDAHKSSQLDFMSYGVWTARRGWVKKTDVINTLSYSDLQSMLK